MRRLSEQQTREVADLEKRKAITDFERGMVAAFLQATNDPDEVRRLERLRQKGSA